MNYGRRMYGSHNGQINDNAWIELEIDSMAK